MPGALEEPIRVLQGMSIGAPRRHWPTAEETKAAKEAIMKCDDKDAAAFEVLRLASAALGSKGGLRSWEVVVAVEIAGRLPREAVMHHLRPLAHLQTRELPELISELTQACQQNAAPQAPTQRPAPGTGE